MKVYDVQGNLVDRQVKGEQDGLEGLLLLHLVDLVRRPQVELAQVRHSAVRSTRDVLQRSKIEIWKHNVSRTTFFWWAVFSSSENLTLTNASKSKADTPPFLVSTFLIFFLDSRVVFGVATFDFLIGVFVPDLAAAFFLLGAGVFWGAMVLRSWLG